MSEQIEDKEVFTESEQLLSKTWLDLTNVLVDNAGTGGTFALLANVFLKKAKLRKEAGLDCDMLLVLAKNCKEFSYAFDQY